MRAYVEASRKLSIAMARVAGALTKYAPADVEIVETEERADLVVLHVIGYPETVAAAERLTAAGKRYAIIQYCLRSTQKAHTCDWMDVWHGAACVWSYYDLYQAMVDDGVVLDMAQPMPFYYAPLGVDAEVFYPRDVSGDRYAVLTSGYVAESECIGEMTDAAARIGRHVFHLGPKLSCHGPRVTQCQDINDDQLAWAYSRADFVSGLRRCEGFEVVAAEGLLCGARPIVFDRPHYQAWYGPWAEFIPENGTGQGLVLEKNEAMTDALADILRRGPRPVTPEEIAAARARFDWQTIVVGFWSHIGRST